MRRPRVKNAPVFADAETARLRAGQLREELLQKFILEERRRLAADTDYDQVYSRRLADRIRRLEKGMADRKK